MSKRKAEGQETKEDEEEEDVKFADNDLQYRPGEPICYIFTTHIDAGMVIDEQTKFARVPVRCLTEETLQQLKAWNELKVHVHDCDRTYNKPVKREKESGEKFIARMEAYKTGKRTAKLFFIVKSLSTKAENITCRDFAGRHDVYLVVEAKSVVH